MANPKTNERILINATHPEEIRIALTSDQFLENVFIEELGGHRTGNVYLGRVSRVVPSLEAAFVEFGSTRHGFLPLKEVAPEYFRTQLTETEHNQYSIADVLSEGQEVLVQVEKEERGNKGAALTTFITLAGCYLVLMPNNPRAGGISRRIEGEDRDALKSLMNILSVPEHMGLIIRTAGVGRAAEELQWDLDVLLRLWEAIKTATKTQSAPCLIHEESDVVIRAFRDYLRKDVSEIIIDNTELYQRARQHLARIHPEIVDNVKLYDDKTIPLFTRYHIENQIETAFKRDVRLPSGGFIVIQETEALVAIDVNSAKDTKSDNIEKTALNTNREAAVEIARQLRLRDLGGIIVIDFIDMESVEHQQQVLKIFKEEIRTDKARVQYCRDISRFGLLEVSRQRLRPSLREASQIVCPRCSGLGSIRSIESLSLHLLRLTRHESMNENVAEIIVQVPIDVATFLLNEKRHMLDEIERHQQILVRIIPNPHMETPDYKIEKLYGVQASHLGRPSYAHQQTPEFIAPPSRASQQTKREEPVVKPLETPVKPVIKPKKTGLFERLFSFLQASEKNTPKTREKQTHKYPRKEYHPHKKGHHAHHQGSSHAQYKQGGHRHDNKRRHTPHGNKRDKFPPRMREAQEYETQSSMSSVVKQQEHLSHSTTQARPVVTHERPVHPPVNVQVTQVQKKTTPTVSAVPTVKIQEQPAVQRITASKPAPIAQEKQIPPAIKAPASVPPVLKPKAPPVIIQPNTPRPGDKARKFHQQQMDERRKNPYKYKMKEKKQTHAGAQQSQNEVPPKE